METYKPLKNVICVVSDEDSRIYKWEKKSDCISDNLEIISINVLRSMPMKLSRELFAVHDIEEGMIFIKDPISNVYYLATEAENKLSENKNKAIDHIAMLLGAKRIFREIESVRSTSRFMEITGHVSYKIVEVDLNVNSSNVEKYKKNFAQNRTFEGCAPEEGYDLAVKYCEDTGLIYDPAIRFLLESRNPLYPNKEKSNDIRIEITNDCESSKEIAFSLNVLKGFFNLDARCEQAINQSTRLIIHSRIEY